VVAVWQLGEPKESPAPYSVKEALSTLPDPPPPLLLEVEVGAAAWEVELDLTGATVVAPEPEKDVSGWYDWRVCHQRTARDALRVVRVREGAGVAGDTGGAAGEALAAALSVGRLGREGTAGSRGQEDDGGQHVGEVVVNSTRDFKGWLRSCLKCRCWKERRCRYGGDVSLQRGCHLIPDPITAPRAAQIAVRHHVAGFKVAPTCTRLAWMLQILPRSNRL